jgi:hypothetical protein
MDAILDRSLREIDPEKIRLRMMRMAGSFPSVLLQVNFELLFGALKDNHPDDVTVRSWRQGGAEVFRHHRIRAGHSWRICAISGSPYWRGLAQSRIPMPCADNVICKERCAAKMARLAQR